MVTDDGTELFYAALNFSDQDQTLPLQLATNGVYLDVLNRSNVVNVVGNRSTVTIEAKWGHVFISGGVARFLLLERLTSR